MYKLDIIDWACTKMYLQCLVVLWSNLQIFWSTVCLPQGEQGPQGPPGPFEYVDPPEDFYIKGEQVELIYFAVVLKS